MRLCFSFLVIFAAHAHACSCGGNFDSVKQAWRKAPFVFLGTVELATPDGSPNQMIFRNQSVRVRVDEAFKGVIDGQKVELYEYGNDCSAKFRTGQHAVFYLYSGGTPGSMVVPWCTYALGNAAPGGDDLLFLHGLPRSAMGTRLSGEVDLYEDSAKQAFRLVGGMANVPVTISGSGGATLKTKTNADGVYEVYNLPPGTYTVFVGVPTGLRADFPVVTGAPASGDSTTVKLVKDGGVSVGFVLKADTRLSGRMLDANGDPIKDVCIDLEPLEGRGEDGAQFFDCSKAGGQFQMQMMPPGKYRLVAGDEVVVNGRKSKSTLYYPGVRRRENGTIISIEPSKYLEHLDIRVPAHEQRYELTGRMLFDDGTPVREATVTFVSSEHGYTEKTETAADGSFDFLVVAGMKGELGATLPLLATSLTKCPGFDFHQAVRSHPLEAKPIAISSDSDQKDLRLTLKSPSCDALAPPQN